MDGENEYRTRLEWRPRAAAKLPAYVGSRMFKTAAEAVSAARELAGSGSAIDEEFRLVQVDAAGASIGPARYFTASDQDGHYQPEGGDDGASLPGSTDGAATRWARSLARANARMIVMTGIRQHLVGAWNHGLLKRAQAATIADIVEMAFDGFGPAGLPTPNRPPGA